MPATNPASSGALSRLAVTLQLSPGERAYLLELADKREPAQPQVIGTMDAPAAVNAIDAPACVLDRLWRARAWNAAAADLFIGWLDLEVSGGDRSLLRYMFLSPAARALVVDWPDRARRLLAEFRLEQGRRLDDPEMTALVADLSQRNDFFHAAWEEQGVIAREGGARAFFHPLRGPMSFEQVTFVLSSRPEFKLVILVPAASGGEEG
jgi:hypothetical protein